MTNALTIKATKPQGAFLSLPQRFKAFVSGYGGGKTFVGCMASCRKYWGAPLQNQGYFAPTYSQIRDIFYPSIDEVASLFGLTTDIKEGNKEVHFYSGKRYRGTTICRSLDRPQSIVGFTIGHAFVDELDLLPIDKARMAWQKIIARMRLKDAANTIDLTTTPEGYRFTYQQFKKALQETPELANRYALVQASTRDNAGNLPADYIPSLIETYPAELVDAYVDGQFVNLTSGTVYRNYDRKTHNSYETINRNETLYVGMDFNVEHMAASIFVQRPDGYHAVAEIKDVFDTPDMIELIKGRYPGHKIIVYPDASGRSRKTMDASTSDISLLQEAGFSIRVKDTNPSIRDRVLAVNKGLEAGKLKVNASQCPTIADCLEQQSYGPNGEPDKKSGHDHQNDSFGYFVAYEMPVVKPAHDFKISFAA